MASCVPTPVDVAVSLGIASKNNRASPLDSDTVLDQKIELLVRRQLLDTSNTKFADLNIRSENRIINISGQVNSGATYIEALEVVWQNNTIRGINSDVEILLENRNLKLANEIRREISHPYSKTNTLAYSIEVIGNRIYIISNIINRVQQSVAIKYSLAAYPEKEIIGRLILK